MYARVCFSEPLCMMLRSFSYFLLQSKRREGIKKRGRQNFGESLARGGKGLVMGIFDGVTGVATKPIEGAREEGVGGFFKGVGKGVVGLVARPTGGIIDFASGTFDSVKRVTEVTEEVNRVRPPRFLDQVILSKQWCMLPYAK